MIQIGSDPKSLGNKVIIVAEALAISFRFSPITFHISASQKFNFLPVFKTIPMACTLSPVPERK